MVNYRLSCLILQHPYNPSFSRGLSTGQSECSPVLSIEKFSNPWERFRYLLAADGFFFYARSVSFVLILSGPFVSKSLIKNRPVPDF
jgi:hypothetical protein